MFFASIRTFRMPSLSARTSSGLLPCTIFQYREEMTGICPQRKNLFSWSSVAVVPARLADTTAAAGFRSCTNRLKPF